MLHSAHQRVFIHATKGENTDANILSASPMPRGIEAPDQVNPNSIIDVDSTPFEEIEALPDFIKNKMKSSEEYQGRLRYQAAIENGVGKIEPPEIVKRHTPIQKKCRDKPERHTVLILVSRRAVPVQINTGGWAQ